MSHSQSKDKQNATRVRLAPAEDIKVADESIKLKTERLMTNWFGLEVTMQDIIAINDRRLEPLTTEPAVEELQARLGLVHGDHVATAVQAHEGEVAVRLDLANLLANVLVLLNDKVLQLLVGKLILAGPLKGLGPGLVAEPVADKVSIAGVNEHGDLLNQTGNQAVVGLHPVTVEEEVAVDVKVARVIAVNFGTEGLTNALLVEVLGHVAHALVAQIRGVLALAADVVDVLAGALVRGKQSVVAVDRGRDTDPGALAIVAGLDHGQTAGKSVVHGLARSLVEDGWVTTLTASHGAVVLVLGQAIGQTVTDKHGLQVNVAVLVRQNLRGKDGDVVASVGLASDVEVLLGVLGELLEEQGQQSIDVLASSDGVTDTAAAVGVANVDGLVQEDDGSIGVPGVVIVDKLDLAVHRARTELQEETGQRRAAGATVQPEDDGVVLRVVTGFEEPWKRLATIGTTRDKKSGCSLQ